MKRLVFAAVSIFLAGIVTVADQKQLCQQIDPAACVILDGIKSHLQI